MPSRLETLRQLLEQTPENSFLRYGLAMEHVNTGDLEGAMREFASLLEHDAGYKAAYFHAGQTLEKLGRREEARDMYRRGIEVTTRFGDLHARGELQGALDLLA